MGKFKLDNYFITRYSDLTPPWGPVGEVTFLRTYSRDGETWTACVRRVVEGTYEQQRKHCKAHKRPWDAKQAQRSAREMFDLMWNMKFLPPGRGLRNMGADIVDKVGGACLNNCGFVSTQHIKATSELADPFCWAMDHLMLGVGVGFDTLGAGTRLVPPTEYSLTYKIPDCREGWVMALDLLLHSYDGVYLSSQEVLFDYSQIRPAGSPICGFGGIASGPEPLREMLDSIRDLLDSACATGGKLTSTHINDIMAMIGRCVVSGGVRRSAEISFIEAHDTAGMQLKNRELWPEQTAQYRWAANHSVKCVPGETDYEAVLKSTEGVAELGIFWLENAQKFGRMGRRPDHSDWRALGCNPCAEQTLEHKELCCLVEVFISRISDEYELQKVLKYAYLYAKTVSTVEVHDRETNAIISRNRRIGCSPTGVQQAIAQRGAGPFYSLLDSGYKYLKQLDARYSTWLGVNRSIKLTSVKPSGTVSKLPGVSSGIHFPVSDSYFQVIRFAASSPLIEPLRAAGYKVVDLHPGEPNTVAVYFGVLDDSGCRAEHEVSIWEQAEHAAKLQHYWADNQISVTVKYKPEERSELAHLLALYEDRLKAISFFPLTDHGFDHAPWQPAPREEVQKYLDSLDVPNYTEVVNTHDSEDEFCSGESCTIPQKE